MLPVVFKSLVRTWGSLPLTVAIQSPVRLGEGGNLRVQCLTGRSSFCSQPFLGPQAARLPRWSVFGLFLINQTYTGTVVLAPASSVFGVRFLAVWLSRGDVKTKMSMPNRQTKESSQVWCGTLGSLLVLLPAAWTTHGRGTIGERVWVGKTPQGCSPTWRVPGD